MAVLRQDAWPEEAFGGFAAEEVRCEVEPAVGEPQSVEDHRLHSLPDGDVPLLLVLGDQFVDHVGDAEFIDHASYESEVLDGLALVHGGRHNFSMAVKTPAVIGGGPECRL